jgi:hypothetical protein
LENRKEYEIRALRWMLEEDKSGSRSCHMVSINVSGDVSSGSTREIINIKES